MKLPYAPYHIESLLQKYYNVLNAYEQKFIIDMLLRAEQNQSVSQKQYNYCETIIHRLKFYESKEQSWAKNAESKLITPIAK